MCLRDPGLQYVPRSGAFGLGVLRIGFFATRELRLGDTVLLTLPVAAGSPAVPAFAGGVVIRDFAGALLLFHRMVASMRDRKPVVDM